MVPPDTTRLATLKLAEYNVPTLPLVNVALAAVKFVNPVALPPVIVALLEVKLVMWPFVEVTSPDNVPVNVVAVTLPTKLPVTLPTKLPVTLPTTLPVTFPVTAPVNAPTTLELNVVPDKEPLIVIPGLIYVKPGIAGLGKNGLSVLNVAITVLPNCN